MYRLATYIRYRLGQPILFVRYKNDPFIVSAIADRYHKWIFQNKKNPSPDLGPSDPDPGLGVVAIAVKPGWKTIHAVLFAVAALPRVGSQGQVVMKVPQGDAGAARRGLARTGSPYLPAARCRAEGTT
jgi:hypothetical protein